MYALTIDEKSCQKMTNRSRLCRISNCLNFFKLFIMHLAQEMFSKAAKDDNRK